MWGRGHAGSGFRLVDDAVRDGHNDNDDYECLAVSASLLPTDRINLTFWRRNFILTVTVRCFSVRLLMLSLNKNRRGTDCTLEYTALQNHQFLFTGVDLHMLQMHICC